MRPEMGEHTQKSRIGSSSDTGFLLFNNHAQRVAKTIRNSP